MSDLSCIKCDMCKRDDCPSLTHITFEVYDSVKDKYHYETKHICLNCQQTIRVIINFGHYQEWTDRGFSEIDTDHPTFKISKIIEENIDAN